MEHRKPTQTAALSDSLAFSEEKYAFISYSSYNYAAALEIKNVLCINRIPCWMAPRSIPAGSDYAQKIPPAIKDCSVFVLALSEESQNSNWVPKELDYAIKCGKPVIPFHMDSSALQDAFDFKLINVQRINAYQRLSDGHQELIHEIHALWGIQQTESTPVKFSVPQRFPIIQPGAIIDNKYKILYPLGNGRFTSVYLAENMITGKRWTIKELSKEADYYQDYIKALSKQLNILSKLNHPALPAIVDILQDDQVFLIVMEYSDGPPLSTHIDPAFQPSEAVLVDWAKQLCDVLIYLHSQKPMIIHNDVNLQNVFLKSNGKLALIDYGSFYEYHPEECNSAGPDTSVLGTLFYAAPELYIGKLDNRGDIYELGASLYILATGATPQEFAYSRVPAMEKKTDISPGLAYIIEKCLERDPNLRYQTAQEMMQDLINIDTLSAQYAKKSFFHKLFPFKKKR